MTKVCRKKKNVSKSSSLAQCAIKAEKSKGKYDKNQGFEIGKLLLNGSCHATVAAIKIQISWQLNKRPFSQSVYITSLWATWPLLLAWNVESRLLVGYMWSACSTWVHAPCKSKAFSLLCPVVKFIIRLQIEPDIRTLAYYSLCIAFSGARGLGKIWVVWWYSV